MSIRTMMKRADSQPEVATEALRARDQARQEHRERIAHRAGWPELRRADLAFSRYTLTHEPTGDAYRVYRGEVAEVMYSPVAAFYYSEDGAVVFLERTTR